MIENEMFEPGRKRRKWTRKRENCYSFKIKQRWKFNNEIFASPWTISELIKPLTWPLTLGEKRLFVKTLYIPKRVYLDQFHRRKYFKRKFENFVRLIASFSHFATFASHCVSLRHIYNSQRILKLNICVFKMNLDNFDSNQRCKICSHLYFEHSMRKNTETFCIKSRKQVAQDKAIHLTQIKKENILREYIKKIFNANTMTQWNSSNLKVDIVSIESLIK